MKSQDIDKMLASEKERILRYRALFNSDEGKKVLEDMKDKFLWQDASPHVLAKNDMSVSYIVGQQMLMRALNRWLTVDLDEYLDRYRKPLELEQGDPLNVGQSTAPGNAGQGYH